MSTSSVNIIDGPNADRVIDALKYAFNKSHPMKIELTLERSEGNLRGTLLRTKAFAQVTGVRYESGAPGMFVLDMNMQVGSKTNSCTAFYNANERSGYILKK